MFSCSSFASTQFIRRDIVAVLGRLFVLFGLTLHTFPKWPVILRLLQCFSFALHIFKCSMVKFSMTNRRQSFVLLIAHTGSTLICGLVSLCDPIAPSSNATANASASCGVASGTVQGFSCTVWFFMFSLKKPCTKLSVWFPKSHSAASPFSECQNCFSVSVCVYFRDKKRTLSSVQFRFVSNVSLQFVNHSCQ